MDAQLIGEEGSTKAEERRRNELVVRAIARRVALARQDPAACFELVMREETSRRRVKCWPHQHLLFDFWEAHPKNVTRVPIDMSKSFCTTAYSMWKLGKDPTARGIVISATQTVAERVVTTVRQYIEESPELRVVFPELRPSDRDDDPWTQTEITVKRPYGIRFPSLAALGYDSDSIPGWRSSWLLIDDLINLLNSLTKDGRDKLMKLLDSTIFTRLDEDGQCCFINTPWHPDDATYRLQDKLRAWPTIEMDVTGNVRLFNTSWDTPLIRPSKVGTEEDHRLTAHDSALGAATLGITLAPGETWEDTNDQVPLCPERYPAERIRKLKHGGDGVLPESSLEFSRTRMCKVRDEDTARIKSDWIGECRKLAMQLGVHGFAADNRPHGIVATTTGVDIGGLKGIGGRKSHRSCVFTVGIYADMKIRPLLINVGKYEGGALVDLVLDHHKRFEGILRVETNGAQILLKQWLRERDKYLPLRSHETGINKLSPQFGIEQVFFAIETTQIMLPTGPTGKGPKDLEEFVTELMGHTPADHTGDTIIACWLALTQARESGFLVRNVGDTGSLAASLMAR